MTSSIFSDKNQKIYGTDSGISKAKPAKIEKEINISENGSNSIIETNEDFNESLRKLQEENSLFVKSPTWKKVFNEKTDLNEELQKIQTQFSSRIKLSNQFTDTEDKNT